MGKLFGALTLLCAVLAAASAAKAQTVSYTGEFLPFYVASVNSQGQAIGYNLLVNGGASNGDSAFPSLPYNAPILYNNGNPYEISVDINTCGPQFASNAGTYVNPVQLTENGRIMVWADQGEACLLTPVPGSAAFINTASGLGALQSNVSGVSNTAAGYDALNANSSGSNNTAFGANALSSNTTGKGNAAQGVNALYSNTTGIRNLGIGSNALYNGNGGYNIALGFDAGYNVTTGNNNIEIGTQGTASDNNTIQIGVQGTQTAATIAGIFGTTLTGSAVYVTSSGQLGVLASSERYKTDVQAMGVASARLLELRPVTFKLKSQPQGPRQYGLIAEQVAEIYPELVIRDDKGAIQGVRYEELAPMLLSEVQRDRQELALKFQAQAAINAEQAASIGSQAAEIRDLKIQLAQLADLKQELNAALRRLAKNGDIVASR